ncbi:DegT/DnrJ/EryC1/StrS family aminotransferase [Streptomyces chartreusis]|uniref:DegT/DnrJ/EryC1/StrS family aminotransferase n=1 Tax=Streptomyces chartreusis TaxID=1969 RepID=UPI003865D255
MSGARHVLGVGNATQTRHLVLPATRPAVGDRVRLPATTFAATASAVLSCGLIPSVDVDDRFLVDTNLLSGDVERVIVVHLDGRVVGISNVRCVIQDCAQAMGAVHPDGAMVGTKGFAGVCSFTTPSCSLRGSADWCMSVRPRTGRPCATTTTTARSSSCRGRTRHGRRIPSMASTSRSGRRCAPSSCNSCSDWWRSAPPLERNHAPLQARTA